MNKSPNLIGKRYGMVVVTKKLEVRNGHGFWLCRCDCGKRVDRSTQSLGRDGDKKTYNCGCLRYGNHIGKKFGLMTVTRQGKTKNNERYWECQCECGNRKEIRTATRRDARQEVNQIQRAETQDIRQDIQREITDIQRTVEPERRTTPEVRRPGDGRRITPPPTRVTIELIEEKLIDLNIAQRRKKKPSKKGPGYQAIVKPPKKKGEPKKKPIILNKKPLPKNLAKDVGAFVVDER